MLGGPLQDGIRDLKMHRLILLVIGVGHEHRGETVEGELAIRLGIDDGRKVKTPTDVIGEAAV